MKLCTDRPAAANDAALDEEEEEEAGADDRHHAARAADRVERLRQYVEERDRDDDAPGQRDQRRQVAMEAERCEAAAERREAGRERERDHVPDHAQRPQVP